MEWTLDNNLLAGLFDQLAIANWQRGGDKANKPKPLPRPGVTDKGKDKRIGGGKVVSFDKLKRLLLKKKEE